MVALVRNEVRQDMPDIEGEIAPHIGRRRGDPAPVGTPKPQELLDGGGTVAKGPDKVWLLDRPAIDQRGNTNPVRLAEGSNPHAPRIVDMASDHSWGAAGCTRDGVVPNRGREAGDEESGDARVSLPGREDDLFETK